MTATKAKPQAGDSLGSVAEEANAQLRRQEYRAAGRKSIQRDEVRP